MPLESVENIRAMDKDGHDALWHARQEGKEDNVRVLEEPLKTEKGEKL